MTNKRGKLSRYISKGLSIGLSAFIALSGVPVSAASYETPEMTFTGSNNATVIINNLNYQDVGNSNTWAKEAIYRTGALELMKGYGDRQFGLGSPISKEQALAMVYRAVSREADAQRAAEALDSARTEEEKKTDAVSMWSDGYLQLAANEGLITPQNLADALTQDPAGLDAASFYRGAAAQRQELAYWFARVLNLQPVYNQQEIFNSFSDWRSADPTKIPYIEPILQNNIMNGDGGGRFSPTGILTREQAAQIIKNAGPVILPLMQLEERRGIVEGITAARDLSTGTGAARTTIDVRNVNGKLHRIQAFEADTYGSGRNEQGGAVLPGQESELVVYKNGILGKSSLLEQGDRIEYITGADNSVKYVNVLSNSQETSYIAVQIRALDTASQTLTVSQLFGVEFPGPNGEILSSTFDIGTAAAETAYRYSSNILVEVNSRTSDIAGLIPGMTAVLSIQNGMVYGVKTVDLGLNGKETGIVKGIVQDLSPQLGYITLYNEDGTGTGPDYEQQLILYRTYNFEDPGDVEVYKNHKRASLADIEVGDTAFLKTDEEANVTSISAVDNYSLRYGKIISKNPGTLTVEYDDGTQQALIVGSNVPIVADGSLADYSALKEGGRVRLLLNITNRSTDVKEIVFEGSGKSISNIYKGNVSYINSALGELVTQNLEVFKGGQWYRTEQKGVSSVKLSGEVDIFINNKAAGLDEANRYAKNTNAYIAVEKDFGGQERAVVISFINKGDTEVLYDDSILSSVPGRGEFTLTAQYRNIRYSPGSILVKEGRLVQANSLASQDPAYIAASRSSATGEYHAGVVQIDERPNLNQVKIYRGRIKAINDGRDFTLESFSQLDGLTWTYVNTPATLSLGYETRILDDSGIVNPRDFIGYGEDSFAGQVVYVLAKDSAALLITTAPYGSVNARGEIYGINGTEIKLKNAQIYNLSSWTWRDSGEMTVSLAENTMLLKGNDAIQPSELQINDRVRVLKQDSGNTGDAYILIVEK